MSRRTYALLALGLAVVLFFAFNIFTNSALRQARLDLTENSLFTLNPGTIRTIETLGEPITLTFYYSEQLATSYPQIAAHARRVRDLLDALASRSKGKIRVQIVKPDPFSPEEDRAVAAGVTAVPTSTGETIYFGLEATNLADGRETIAYLSPDRENLLEYDLVSLIDRLNRLKKPVLGLMGDLPLATGPGGPYAALQGKSKPYRIYSELEAKFQIDFIGSEPDRIPANIDVLMVVHPNRISPRALYAIDQFVLGGGHALVFIDPLSELALESAQGDPSAATASSLGPLLAAWGVAMPKDEVVGDRTLARPVIVDETTRRIANFVAWLGLTASEISREDPVTAEINQINLGTPGHLERLKDAKTTLVPLLTSSDDAMIIDAQPLQIMPDPDDLLRRFRPSGVRYTLAARVTGPAGTAFPNGPPPAAPGAEESPAESKPAPAAPLTQSKTPINVILVADTDIFDDRLWLSSQSVMGQQVSVPTASNGDFVLNAADNLSGSNALLSLRGRQVADRRFELVDTLRREAEQRYLAEEDRLNAKIAETQRNLEALQRQGTQTGGEGEKQGIVVTPAQRAEIERFRQELNQTRNALRAVQHNLRSDIDALGGWLKLINIALMPLLVAGGAVIYAVIQRRRRARKAWEAKKP
jgi:ABC-type uncharacterized transport system involved in gliding motility auxiliary subunit